MVPALQSFTVFVITPVSRSPRGVQAGHSPRCILPLRPDSWLHGQLWGPSSTKGLEGWVGKGEVGLISVKSRVHSPSPFSWTALPLADYQVASVGIKNAVTFITLN